MKTLKVLVVGQTPPPHGGQAMMIQRLLDCKLSDVQLIHVRMNFSSSMGEIGKLRWSKIAHLVALVVRIAYRRIVDGASMLYYPPAGPDRVPMWRDVAILTATRWMFKRTVFHYHAGGISELYDQLPAWQRWLFRRAYFGADAAVRLSEFNPEDGRRLDARHDYIIPYGIEDPRPGLVVSRPTAAAIANSPLRLLFVGIVCESKGVMVLIEACGELAARGVSFQLELMGHMESAAFAERIKRRIHELGLVEQVRHLGVRMGDEKFAAFQRSDVLCFPTFFNCETFGLVLLEAMACGLPTVATSWRGIPSIVGDGETGFLVEPHDSAAFAERLIALAGDAELRERMGRAGRAKFEREYTLPLFADRMRQMLLETSASPTVEVPAPCPQPNSLVKVLVVGQMPPPFGGAPILIERLVKSDLPGLQLVGVRMAFSSQLNEHGRVRLSKLVHLIALVTRIVYHRIRDGVRILYYVPSGPDRKPMFRDFLVLLPTRWLFDKTVFHFHLGGVSELYDELPGWQRWLFRRAYFGADAAVRVSERNPQDGRRLEAQHEYIIPNGIDDPCPAWKPSSELRAANDPLRILFVGMLRESKGVADLVEACGLLAAQGVPFELEIMGPWESEEFAERVRSRIDELKIGAAVRFLGVLVGDEKFAAYRRTDVLCFPTFYNSETFGLVLVEAMAHGLPVVATRWRGIPDLVEEGGTGFLVEPHDPAAVADRLAVLAADPALGERLGRAGRHKFEREFTIVPYLNRLRAMLLETAARPRGEPGVARSKRQPLQPSLEAPQHA